MKQFLVKATYQKWLAVMCIPLLAVTMLVTTGCNSTQVTAYVNLAVDTANALVPLIPGLQPVLPFLSIAQAGLSGWKAGQPIPQNVIAALQSALPVAEQDIPGITTAQKQEISILLAAIISALTIAGVATAPRPGMQASQYAGKTPQQLRKMFNAQASAAGVKAI